MIKGYIADVICGQVSDFEIDENKIVDTRATMALTEIRKILDCDALTDFEIVEEIVKVFIKYELSYGSVHDF